MRVCVSCVKGFFIRCEQLTALVLVLPLSRAQQTALWMYRCKHVLGTCINLNTVMLFTHFMKLAYTVQLLHSLYLERSLELGNFSFEAGLPHLQSCTCLPGVCQTLLQVRGLCRWGGEPGEQGENTVSGSERREGEPPQM